MSAWPMTDAEREAAFWAKVDKRGPDECWEWQGGQVAPGSYGLFWDGFHNLMAHRFSWMIENGPVPDGLLVLHSCDNPPCCNPAHLHLGTHADNAREKYERGRANNVLVQRMQARTHCARGHPYSVENTIRWRNKRRCRACRQEEYGKRRIAAGLPFTPRHAQRKPRTSPR